jgi:site-specific recombinase XerD
MCSPDGSPFRWRARRAGDVQAWLADLSSSGHSGASVRKSFGVLSAILDLAVRDKRLPSKPAHVVDLPRSAKRRKKYLSAAQVAAAGRCSREGTQCPAGARIPPVPACRTGNGVLRLALVRTCSAQSRLG